MKKMAMIGLMAGAMIVGCGGNNSSSSVHHSSPVPCQDPAGTYHIDYTTVSGNCGDVQSIDVVLPEPPPSQSSPCSITGSHTSSDNCSASVSETCHGNYPNGRGGTIWAQVTLVLTVDDNTDASVITGTVEETVSGGCQGSYTFTETRTHE